MNATLIVRITCEILDTKICSTIKILAGHRISLEGKDFNYRGEYCPKTMSANGQGVLTIQSSSYSGQFRMGRIEGYGRCTTTNGTQYIGYFIDGKAHGIGQCESTNYTIKGSWANGMPDGSCLIYDKTNDIWFSAVYHTGRQVHVSLAYGADRIRTRIMPISKRCKANKARHKSSTQHKIANRLACSICYEHPKKYCATPCGHYYACDNCRDERCAMCRQPVIQWVKIFE